MTRARPALLALACLAALVGRAGACWMAIDPQVLARHSPLIATGTIVRVEPADPAAGRHYDTAVILIEAVHRNVLSDVQAAPGCEVPALMSSEDHARAISVAIRFPAGTRATWLIEMDRDGSLRINHHPAQCQPAGDLVPLGRLDGARGSYTTARWLARMEAQKSQDELLRWSRGVAIDYAPHTVAAFAVLFAGAALWAYLRWELRRWSPAPVQTTAKAWRRPL